MVHITFDVNSVRWDDFFQEGGGPYFEGVRFQRGFGVNYIDRQHGAGLGRIFAKIFRYLLPVARKAGKTLAKEGLETGSRILQDIAQGANVKEALVSEAKQGIENLSQRMKGKGRRVSRKRRKGRRRSVANIAKRKKVDTLGFY